MRALVVTLAIGLLAVVSEGHLVHHASTGKVGSLRWQPSHAIGHQSRKLQQSTPSSFASANNITSTIVNATRDGGFLVVSILTLMRKISNYPLSCDLMVKVLFSRWGS